MKLTENGKIKLRKNIEELLEEVTDNKLIKLDKNLLEEMIFQKIQDEQEKEMKIIVWSGPFLSKIDLSEV